VPLDDVRGPSIEQFSVAVEYLHLGVLRGERHDAIAAGDDDSVVIPRAPQPSSHSKTKSATGHPAVVKQGVFLPLEDEVGCVDGRVLGGHAHALATR